MAWLLCQLQRKEVTQDVRKVLDKKKNHRKATNCMNMNFAQCYFTGSRIFYDIWKTNTSKLWSEMHSQFSDKVEIFPEFQTALTGREYSF